MSFDTIPGQQGAKELLRRHIRTGRVSHAYLFEGPPGTGKAKAAFAFAQACLCSGEGEKPCGVCADCRKAEHGNHPDLVYIRPDGASVKIDQIRELQKLFSFRSGGQRKIYIIEQADRMTDQAANGLLKFLEEPVSGVSAILLTSNSHALLPTIRSRTQAVSFTPLPAGEIVAALLAEDQPEPLARAAAQLASGVDAARELFQSNGFAEVRKLSVQLAKEALTRLPSAYVTAGEKFAKSDLADHAGLLFSFFILFLKDMIHIQSGKPERVVFTDYREDLKQLAFTRSAAAWTAGMDKAVELQRRLRLHANPQLAVEQFLTALGRG